MPRFYVQCHKCINCGRESIGKNLRYCKSCGSSTEFSIKYTKRVSFKIKKKRKIKNG